MNMLLSRRTFLGSLAATGSLALAQEFKSGQADIKLGIASYSFRKFPRDRAIEMTHQLRTPYLNVKSFHLALESTPEQIDAARKQFADAGIIIVGVGTIYFEKDDPNDIRAKFEYAKRLGAPLIVGSSKPDMLPKIEPFVKEFDIKLAIHNHGPEDKNFPTPQSVLKVVANMDPRVGLCMDVGHTMRTGTDIVQAIGQAGPRLLDMHAKDLAKPISKEAIVPVGEGKLPWPGIVRKLVEIGYTGCVNLEYEAEENNPLPSMQISMAYLRGLLSEAAYITGPMRHGANS